ncbi:glycine/D-amino acid oxidase-like deaminating enzyme/nitrite reductase/ring-hydroxylating ferredoxin subunit [Phyllobacterium ifriqiyense]|uniref:Glycine/D-amino acid oxidase-like deaminating enzyme/nitrite reductase/ring-hydroxylating ferredoxin subunit n=1 Tax=Phyllobacterium ifriqiyense TaxID=314238 RepID=A0ABU0S5M0_9HYPH|nr:FAD-dependent oxidoreductase [Phyllobacterium ifriqiyense]MDQ0995215.1 glycine/D-amino acid oxidase-like deaminating enzyme/nitrite reductase/ring-hydroxylating ferredoxin subunit [Phyllobacterium ifriqiyense]
MKNQPLWFEGVPSRHYPALEQALTVDVAVIGGGIVGLYAAHRLQQAGFKVALFEARTIGRQATGRSTAKVTSQHGMKYARLIDSFGSEAAKIYALANQLAAKELAALAQTMSASCGLEERSAYIYATNAQEAEQLARERDAARSLGLHYDIVNDIKLPFHPEASLKLSGQYQLDPYAFCVSLAENISLKANIFEDSRVTQVDYGEPCVLQINGHDVRANHVIVATQLPIISQGHYFTKAYPFAHPVIAAPMTGEPSFEGMFISAGSPSHSFRTATKNGIAYLVAAGPEFKPGQADEQTAAIENLHTFVERNFGLEMFSHLWINEDFRTMDELPFVGPVKASQPRLQVVTGLSAWGITQAAVSAEIVTGNILQNAHPCAALFDATRMDLVRGAGSFVANNTAAGVRLLKDRLFRSQVQDKNAVPAGGAGIILHNGEQVALRRGEDGSEFALSAVCTHLGCIVGWNQADETWDCPCHGSRFDKHGQVISGPATLPLARRDLRENP